MIARLCKTYYFADSFVENDNLFLYKKRLLLPRKLQKNDNVCGFQAVYSAFLLFKFFQKNLNHTHVFHFYQLYQ